MRVPRKGTVSHQQRWTIVLKTAHEHDHELALNRIDEHNISCLSLSACACGQAFLQNPAERVFLVAVVSLIVDQKRKPKQS